jgi:hypothetical protein
VVLAELHWHPERGMTPEAMLALAGEASLRYTTLDGRALETTEARIRVNECQVHAKTAE